MFSDRLFKRNYEKIFNESGKEGKDGISYAVRFSFSARERRGGQKSRTALS